MIRIFTKRFFRLSTPAHTAIVEAVLDDLERNYGRFLNPEDERRARRWAQLIRMNVVEGGC